MTRTSPKLATLDQVADALTDIARTADTELTWSDHGSDKALRRIAADANGALSRLGYALPAAAVPQRDVVGQRRALDP